MSLKSQLVGAVDSAFTAVGDLVVQVTLTKASASGYNFGTGSVATTNVANVSVSGILLDEVKDAEGNRATYDLYLKAKEVDNIETYDSFEIAGKTYKLSSYEDNGFVIIAKVVGELGGVTHV